VFAVRLSLPFFSVSFAWLMLSSAVMLQRAFRRAIITPDVACAKIAFTPRLPACLRRASNVARQPSTIFHARFSRQFPPKLMLGAAVSIKCLAMSLPPVRAGFAIAYSISVFLQISIAEARQVFNAEHFFPFSYRL